jgi:sulfide:quinone oxidoreductase
MKKRIVIIGSSFAGYTAALTLSKLLGANHDIIVVDKTPEFTFIPSLVWHPFGYRTSDDISFDTRTIYDTHGVHFIEGTAYGVDLDEQIVYTRDRDINYDYLLIATGTKPKFSTIKGMDPGKNCYTVTNYRQAEKTKEAWKNFLQNPGPMVIGATQRSGYIFAAYEFLINALYHLREHDLLDKVPITFITPEPFLTHFGIGGVHQDAGACADFFDRYQIAWHTDAEIHAIKDRQVVLEPDYTIDSDFTFLVPQMVGADAMRTTRSLSDQHGLIRVNTQFQHENYDNIYAAGGAVFIDQKDETPVPCDVPRTRFCTEIMAKTAAHNIASDILNGGKVEVSNNRIYQYCKQDIEHLGDVLFKTISDEDHDLDFIKKGSQDKWTNMTIESYIEAALVDENLQIDDY